MYMPSDFKSLLSQERPLRQLSAVLSSGMMPHAILFTGLTGVGKAACALMVAMAVNCRELFGEDTAEKARGTDGGILFPCGKCQSCRKIHSGNHPDVIQIKPSGTWIKIDQIRDLIKMLSYKPHEAMKRVVVIESADTMNPEAGNALLKMLEEPPDKTMLILTSDDASTLLPTIVSRCRHIRFNPVPISHIKTYLMETFDIKDDIASQAAWMAEGSLSRAVDMKNTAWINRRQWLVHEVSGLSSKPLNMVLSFSERLFKKKDMLQDSLDIISSFLRDLAVFHFDPESVINQDLKDIIARASGNASVGLFIEKFNAVQTARKKIASNGNVRLTLETLALQLAKK